MSVKNASDGSDTHNPAGAWPGKRAAAADHQGDRPPLSEETACPLCGRREYRDVSRIDRRGRPLRTVMCDVCGLVWTNPRPADADVDRYYETEYRLDYSRSRTPTRRKIVRGLLGAAERRQALGPFLPRGARVLDVGCGAGEFVYLLRQDGVDAAGIEPGHEFAAFCRDTLRIPVQTTTVERAIVEPGGQTLITMFHMLEHVADPRRTLEIMRDWLVPGTGRLVVEVPNVDATVQAPRHRFHYAHLYTYSAATLAAFGAVAGLRLVSSYESDDGGNITCIFASDAGTPDSRPALPRPDTVARTRAVLQGHTTVGHYLTPGPYIRMLAKIARRWREDRLLARLPTVERVLEWASGLRTGPPV